MLGARYLNPDDSKLNSSVFKELCDSISLMAQSEGITIHPYTHENTPYFNKLDDLQQKTVIDNISKYANTLSQTLSLGHKISDSKQLSWNAFKYLKLRPSSDFFSYITNDSIVEIYATSGIQVFRNMRFFEICSYTLEDLYCRPWFDLYDREPAVISKIEASLGRLLSGEVRHSFYPEIGLHWLREKNSPFMYELKLDVDCIAPVVDETGSSSTYFSVVETVSILNKLNNTEKTKILNSLYSSQTKDAL